MSPLLIGMLGILLMPLFVASWRLSLLALAGQGLILAWIGYQLDPFLDSAASWLSLFDLLVMRGVAAPLVLYAALRAHKALPRADVLPPNLMSWTLAIAAVLASFRFAEMMAPGESAAAAEGQTFIAVATASLLLGVLLLATQTGPFSQMVGVVRIENAIALFELGSAAQPPTASPSASAEPALLELGSHHGHALGLSIAQIVILALTLWMFRWYLQILPPPATGKVSAVEGLRT